MTDRLLRTVKHGLVVLCAAVFSFVLLRQAADAGSDPVPRLIALALLSYAAWQLGRPVWRAWQWWRTRRPPPQRPDLPLPAQWITPRDHRRRNHHDVR